MAAIFQIRRGSGSVPLVDGELYLHNGEGSIQFGSGSNNYTLLPLNTPINGDINLIGNISASGDVKIGGNIYLGDNLANDSINVNSPFSGSIIPSGSNTFDLGTLTNVYRNVYANRVSASFFTGSLSGSVNGIDVTNFSTSVDNRLDVIESKYATTGSNTFVGNQIITGSLIVSGSNTFVGTQTITGSLIISGSNIQLSGSNIELNRNWPAVGTESHFLRLAPFTSSTGRYYDGLSIGVEHWDDGSGTYEHSLLIHSFDDDTIQNYGAELNVGPYRTHMRVYPSASVGGLANVSVQELSNGKTQALVYGDYVQIGAFNGEDILIGNTGSLIIISGSNMLFNTPLTSSQPIVATLFSGSISGIGNATEFSSSISNRFLTISNVTSSFNSRLNSLEITSGALNLFTQSALIRLTNLETKSESIDTSISRLHSYTASLNNAIQLTGSTVSFLGNIVVYGTQSVINSQNLEVADNMIYLNATSSTTNVDLGIVGNYNDGTYAHTGIYRDSSDGVWRVFKSYTPEPEGNIDITHASYRYADFYANALSASTLTGIGNITSYSTSVNSRLVSLETNSTNVGNSLSSLNQFSGSTLTRLNELEKSTGSLNTATASLYTSASLMTSSIVSLTSSVTALQAFSGNVNGRFTTLGTYTGSVDGRFTTLGTYTGSVDGRFTTLGTYTGSVDGRFTTLSNVTASLNASSASQQTSIDNLNTFSGSQLGKDATLATYTASVETRFTTLGQVTSSILQYTASVSQSIRNLNIFSSSYYVDSASFDYRISVLNPGNLDNVILGLNTFTASANARFTEIGIVTGSLISSASAAKTTNDSQDVSITNLNSFSSSALTRLTNLEVDTTNLESYTASLKSAISLNGSNVTILGDLNVQGTTTVIETTTLQVKDNIVELNYGGTSTTSGIITRDITGASISGSLLWNATNDIWTAGKLGSEAKILTDGMGVISGSGQLTNYETTGRGIVSGSSQIVSLLPTGVVSGSSQVLGGSGVWSGSAQLPVGTISGSSQVILSSTTGGGTSANVQFGSLGIGTVASGVSGEIRATGDIIAFYSSDERLKENIQPIQNALSKVESISGNTYDWKEGFETIHSHIGHDLGVIAQEVQSVLPEVVTERETGYLAVDYVKLVPVLIQAIKELSAKVKELESK